MHRFGLAALLLAAAPIIAPIVLTRQAQAQPAYAHDASGATRDRLDRPVEEGQADRTWYWLPEPISEGTQETYAESPGGERLVQYMDKARLELTQPDTNQDDAWLVSTDVFAMQVGNSWTYEDPRSGDNLTGPTVTVSEFDFTPFYGVMRDNRGNDEPILELVAHTLN
jgi:hypothetical protein